MTTSIVEPSPSMPDDRLAGLSPLLVDLRDRPCLVVGGGGVAARRAESLVEAGARVSVVAPRLEAALRALVDDGRVGVWRDRDYAPGDADGQLLVVAATDDPQVNRRVGDDARAAGALVNRADEPAAGDVVMPAVVRRGDLVLAVSTGGASPTLAAHVRRELERDFGPEWGGLTSLLGEHRAQLAAAADTPEGRRRVVAEMIGAGVLDHLARGDVAGARILVGRMLSEERS